MGKVPLMSIIAMGAVTAVGIIKHLRHRAKRQREMRAQMDDHRAPEVSPSPLLESNTPAKSLFDSTSLQHTTTNCDLLPSAATAPVPSSAPPVSISSAPGPSSSQPVDDGIRPQLANLRARLEDLEALSVDQRFHRLHMRMQAVEQARLADANRMAAIEHHGINIFDLVTNEFAYINARITSIEVYVQSESDRINWLVQSVQSIVAELDNVWTQMQEASSVIEARLNGLEQVEEITNDFDDFGDNDALATEPAQDA